MNPVSPTVEHSEEVIASVVVELERASKEYNLDATKIIEKVKRLSHTEDKALHNSIFYALNNIDMGEPNWTFVAANMKLQQMYKEASENRGYSRSLKYGSFYKLIKTLTEMGIYSPAILASYSEEEINEIGRMIDPSKDSLFNFIGLFLLNDRYSATDYQGSLYELPQERIMMIAVTTMINEPKATRLAHIQELYWALSNLYATAATPTFANAGKSYGQLSSCFIDKVDDSLDGIYLSNMDAARLSKDGGGVALYFSKVRALGSPIKGFEGKSSGTTPWIKMFNQTAITVDQLGQRKGAFAIYMCLDHKDIMKFLELGLNNGDEADRAREIFTGVAVPDLFMKKLDEVDENGRSIGQWHTFCPHQIKQHMQWKDENGNLLTLDDFYDEKDTKYYEEKYMEAVNNPLLPRDTHRAMDIMVRIMEIQLETGMPYMFYRDEVNRRNPNKHVHGIGRTAIYCSNLCTEIAQNQVSSMIIGEYIDENENIHMVRSPGEYVVCNLASVNLAKAVPAGVLARVIRIVTRMLDNIIDINTISVLQAGITNKRYRPIGMGAYGWHHLLAILGLDWESEAAVNYADTLYEEFAYHVIDSSVELAKEKGTYKYFEGSAWHTGEYFDQRDYVSPKWKALKEKVAKFGVRNGWMMALAPNATTAKVGGSTDGNDPITAVEGAEEKGNFKFKVTAPGLDHNTYNVYRKTRHHIDQLWSIKQTAMKQRHIDQSISFNLYVPSDIDGAELLNIHKTAHKLGLKTTYYVKGESQKLKADCEACHA